MSETQVTEKSAGTIAADTAKAVGKVVGVSVLATITVLAVIALLFVFLVTRMLPF